MAKGLAWSVPAVTVATTLPAFAVSKCLTAPAVGNWSQNPREAGIGGLFGDPNYYLKRNDINAKPFRLVDGNTTVESIADWAWWSGKSRPAYGTTSASFGVDNLDPSTTYRISFDVSTCKGYNYPGDGSPDSCETNPTVLQIVWTPTNGAPTVLGTYSTQSTGNGPFILNSGATGSGEVDTRVSGLVAPPVNCTNGQPVRNRQPLWSTPVTKEVAFTTGTGFTAGRGSGTISLNFYAMPSRLITSSGNGTSTKTSFSNNNDEWRVTPGAPSCTP